MRRIKELEARRRVLLALCEVQRAQLDARVADLNPLALLRGAAGAVRGPLRPLAWVAVVAGLLFLGRTRKVLTFTLWLRSALSIAGRAAQLVRVVSQLRGPRAEGPEPRA
ncbi:MAG TPA: hypothetical protein VKQ31_02865 [Steroidobacteraceae bacterium]|nr:hypothetical protein [Steroidobacteraceae bacterium]